MSTIVRDLVKERQEITGKPTVEWPDEYQNSETGKFYNPHNEDEEIFVYDDIPRYMLLKGGEGAGKSVAGIKKGLDRVKRGMDIIMGSPDLEHFKKSLWPEARRWIPWHCVIERHRYRQNPGWQPGSSFELVFHNELGGYSKIICGGFKEDRIGGWEGGNVSAAHFDEARHHKNAGALKVLDGRCRIPGPNGEPPQLYITTTPKKNWLFEYFGPLQQDDPHRDFKLDSFVGTVSVDLNIENLSEAFIIKRRSSLTESEQRVLMDALWEDEEDTEKFVNMVWWDNCKVDIPPLTNKEALVIAVDANKGSKNTDAIPDGFSIVATSRMPSDKKVVAVRYVGVWLPSVGKLMDFTKPKEELRRLCANFSVIEVAYDPYQLHDTMMMMAKEGIALFREFGQQTPRAKADTNLRNLIMNRNIAHDGNPLLRKHIDNADVVKSGGGIRLVKRANSLKIDAAVATSISSARCLYYNLG